MHTRTKHESYETPTKSTYKDLSEQAIAQQETQVQIHLICVTNETVSEKIKYESPEK